MSLIFVFTHLCKNTARWNGQVSEGSGGHVLFLKTRHGWLFWCCRPLSSSFGCSDDCNKRGVKVSVSARFGCDLSCLIGTKLRTSETKKILVPMTASPPDWAKVNSLSNESRKSEGKMTQIYIAAKWPAINHQYYICLYRFMEGYLSYTISI